ncbi:TPA: superantigen-like protein [Staphylococcus aureus]|nr:superantigen-like protein [Staphylococcus aureus]
MRKRIMKKLIFMTTLLLLGTTATQTPNSPLNVSTEAKAYYIDQNETNINELIKYYTQKPLTFSNRWLYQYDDGNINQLRDRYVDVFGLKDEDTSQLWWVYRDTFTGGVTPAASSSDKPYSLFVQYKDKLQTIIGAHKMYQGDKPILTLKEIDFRAREALIKNKILYHENRNKGKLKITGGGNDYTIDLSKRLHSDLANVYVKNPQKITVEVLID